MSRAIVLVLGHTGFVGQRLAAELRGEGHEVVGYSSATLWPQATCAASEGAA